MSKTFERIAFNQLYDCFISNDLLFDGQYGFWDKHSTELAASELIDRLRNEIDNKKIPLYIFLDLSKAFDTLDHDILLSKRDYGVKSTSLKWFASYLSERSQYVDYDGLHSSVRSIKTGLPQGSILGPLLFMIYMNDINISGQNWILYYMLMIQLWHSLCVNLPIVMILPLTLSLMLLTKNSQQYQIGYLSTDSEYSLNTSKTKFMVFHNYQKIMCDDIPKLIIRDSVIERTREFNFLGLTINESLNWNSHCLKIANKISRTLCVMNRLKRYLPYSSETYVRFTHTSPFTIWNNLLELRNWTYFLLEPVGLVWFWGIIYQNFFRNFRMMFWEKSALTVLILLFRM